MDWINCRTLLRLPGQGYPITLEQFSRDSGDETIHYENRHWSDHASGASDARSSRPLASPDDLRRSSDTILVYANAPPARLKSRRWDQVRTWRSAVESSRSR